MKPERDWMDYANLLSNLAQNAELGGINSNLEEVRRKQSEANEALSAIALGQERESILAEAQNRIRNIIWQGMQSLERAKEQLSQRPMEFACRLHGLTVPPNAADRCSDWEDKKRMQQLHDDVEAQKQVVKKILTPAQYEDTLKCSDAFRYLGELDRYMELYVSVSRSAEEYEETEKRLSQELASLRKQKATTPVKLFSPSSWSLSEDLRKNIQAKEAEIAAHREAGRFGSLTPKSDLAQAGREIFDNPDSESTKQLIKTLEGVSAEVNAKFTRELIEEWTALEKQFEDLLTQYADRNQDAKTTAPASTNDRLALATRYRGELLGAVVRCYQLESLPDAEALVKKLSPSQQAPKASTKQLEDDEHHGAELPSRLSPEVQRLARDPSEKIAAIKLHREQHPGLGLADAKAEIEDFAASGH